MNIIVPEFFLYNTNYVNDIIYVFFWVYWEYICRIIMQR